MESCIEKITAAVLEKGGTCFITADHGNADMMIAEDGSPFTAHTTNPVPFIAVGNDLIGRKLREGGVLADIAPTMLEIIGEEKPAEMTGESLFVKQ